MVVHRAVLCDERCLWLTFCPPPPFPQDCIANAYDVITLFDQHSTLDSRLFPPPNSDVRGFPELQAAATVQWRGFLAACCPGCSSLTGRTPPLPSTQVFARRSCAPTVLIPQKVQTVADAMLSSKAAGPPSSQAQEQQTNEAQPQASQASTETESPEPRILPKTHALPLGSPIAFKVPTTDSGIVSDTSPSPSMSPHGVPALLHVTCGATGQPYYQMAYPGLPDGRQNAVDSVVNEETETDEEPAAEEARGYRQPLVEELGAPPTSRAFPLRPREQYAPSGARGRGRTAGPDLLFVLPTRGILAWNRHLFFDKAWRVLGTANLLRARTLLTQDIPMLRVFSVRSQHANETRRRRRWVGEPGGRAGRRMAFWFGSRPRPCSFLVLCRHGGALQHCRPLDVEWLAQASLFSEEQPLHLTLLGN